MKTSLISISKKEFTNTIFKWVVKSYFKFWQLILMVLVSLFLGYMFVSRNVSIFYIIIVCPLLGIVLYSIYMLLLRFLVPLLKFKKALDQDSEKTSYEVSVSDDCLVFITRNSEKKVFWRGVITAKRYNKYLIIRLLDNSTYLIPDKIFDATLDYSDFFQFILNGILKTRGTLKISPFLRPPYLLGILCFIPILGIFLGIAYIIIGLIQYKSKLMAAIGILGIASTIVLYSILDPGIWNKKIRDNQRAQISKSHLNSLVKDIESYKLKYGKYPENLEQLKGLYSYPMIYDPLQPSTGNNSKFNYIVLGKKYKLFSSGIDRIPNTIDDIYPVIQDLSKTGLIK